MEDKINALLSRLPNKYPPADERSDDHDDFMRSQVAARDAYINHLKDKLILARKTRCKLWTVTLLAMAVAVWQWFIATGCVG